jgi:hypothetical protein
MNVNTLFNDSKAVVFQVLFVFSVVAYGQDSQSSAIAKTPQINLQEGSSIALEDKLSAIGERIVKEDTFSLGKGYLIQVPADHSTVPSTYQGAFFGVPNNGTMHLEMKAGFNMVGNPYPSGINVHHFIDSNPTITGTVYFLKKNGADVSSTSYTTLTKTAYVSNGDKSEDASFGYFEAGDESNWFINVAQGFFVNASNDSKLLFTNRMRRISKANPDFKNSKSAAHKSSLYWLNLNSEDGLYSQMAVGYSSSGTFAVDKGIDGKNINLDFYLTSLIDRDEYAIQGRPEFTLSDIVPLSYKVLTSGKYTILLDHAIGIFEDNSQVIYLKDKKKNKLHNLNNGPYSFVSKAGTFENRFEVVYKTH